ncbi:MULTISPECIES: S24 family peptidase [unclassified Sphingomonas]|uniref:S24 family peptidase n=1 Tax=unclassified Sphingomonas TaxID=196159 RepID=UPI002269E3AD|nr:MULTISPECIES: S24 family peptidase [unclassified Sphingomonas]
MSTYYDKRSIRASASTKFVADRHQPTRHDFVVLSSADLLAALKRLRDEGRTTNAALGRLLDLPSSRIAEIYDGKRKVSVDEAKLIVEEFGLNGSPPPPRPVDDDDTAEIIALDLSLSMGPGTFIEDFVDGEPVRISLGFIQAITRTPTDRLRLVKGIGDSMEPTLRTGDQVLVDINERQLSRINGIYWIDYLGMHGIKRLRAAGQGRLHIGSDNPLVPDFEVDAADVRIEGRVIWFAREL